MKSYRKQASHSGTHFVIGYNSFVSWQDTDCTLVVKIITYQKRWGLSFTLEEQISIENYFFTDNKSRNIKTTLKKPMLVLLEWLSPFYITRLSFFSLRTYWVPKQREKKVFNTWRRLPVFLGAIHSQVTTPGVYGCWIRQAPTTGRENKRSHSLWYFTRFLLDGSLTWRKEDPLGAGIKGRVRRVRSRLASSMCNRSSLSISNTAFPSARHIKGKYQTFVTF